MTNFVLRMLKWLPWVGVALILAGFGIAIHEKAFTDWAGALSVAGVILYLLVFVRGESANVKFYVNVILASALALGILVVAYLWINMRKVEWDFTENKRYSLSDQTVKYLELLKVPTRITGFFSEMTSPQASQAEELLRRYAKRSEMVQVEIVDPFRDNPRVRELKERFDTEIRPRDIFVENASELKEGQKPRFKKVMALEESPITNALIEVTQEKQMVIYCLEGHGEKTTEYVSVNKQDTSISKLKQLLTDRGMKVEPLTLKGFVPDDCTVLLAAGPMADLFQPEADAIKEYLDKGGRALLYFDPPSRAAGQKLPNWAALLKNYGVELTDNIVLDRRGASLGDPTVIIPYSFDSDHEITKDLPQPQEVGMVIKGARAVAKAATMPSGFTATELIKTSRLSWTVPYQELLRTRLTLPAEDQMKELPLALAVHQATSEEGTRLVVFGDADAITDNSLDNLSLALAELSLNWLAGQKELMAIPAKELKDTPLFVSDATMAMIFILVVVALPSAVFFGGLSYTMFRRRTR